MGKERCGISDYSVKPTSIYGAVCLFTCVSDFEVPTFLDVSLFYYILLAFVICDTIVLTALKISFLCGFFVFILGQDYFVKALMDKHFAELHFLNNFSICPDYFRLRSHFFH